MRIEIQKLEEPGGKFSKTYEEGELPLGETDIRLVAPVRITGRGRRDGYEVELTGELQTEVEIACGRCLQPVRTSIATEFDERFVSSVSWRDEELHELKPEDLSLAVFNGEAIDLDELVREEILLAVPTRALCRDDCKGLCAICGVDRNLESCECEQKQIDSRWQKLKELQSSKNKVPSTKFKTK